MKTNDAREKADPRILDDWRNEPSVSYFRGMGRYATKKMNDSKINDVIRSRFKIGIKMKNSTKKRKTQRRTAPEIKIAS